MQKLHTTHYFSCWPFIRRLALLCLMGLAPAYATPTDALPLPASLAQSLAEALRQGEPLVVMVSLDGCPFCKVARMHHLAPMHRQGLPVVQITMRNNQSVLDFKNTSTTHDTLVRLWGVQVAPTLLFFGAEGKEVAERLRGTSIPDYYGAYLDQRLSIARTATKKSNDKETTP